MSQDRWCRPSTKRKKTMMDFSTSHTVEKILLDSAQRLFPTIISWTITAAIMHNINSPVLCFTVIKMYIWCCVNTELKLPRKIPVPWIISFYMLFQTVYLFVVQNHCKMNAFLGWQIEKKKKIVYWQTTVQRVDHLAYKSFHQSIGLFCIYVVTT